jgi:hypothetical protein
MNRSVWSDVIFQIDIIVNVMDRHKNEAKYWQSWFSGQLNGEPRIHFVRPVKLNRSV